jgi:hypothetical protein
MKKLLIIALLPLAIYSCEKDENTNPVFRAITCEDTTDDGVFEEYTMPEAEAFLHGYKSVPIVADANALDFVQMSARILYNNSIDLGPSLIYQQNVPTNLIVYLPIGGPRKYYSWIDADTTLDDTLSVPIYNARSLKLPEGCHRLYYVFSDTAFGKVLNKGHFDIEVRK